MGQKGAKTEPKTVVLNTTDFEQFSRPKIEPKWYQKGSSSGAGGQNGRKMVPEWCQKSVRPNGHFDGLGRTHFGRLNLLQEGSDMPQMAPRASTWSPIGDNRDCFGSVGGQNGAKTGPEWSENSVRPYGQLEGFGRTPFGPFSGPRTNQTATKMVPDRR